MLLRGWVTISWSRRSSSSPSTSTMGSFQSKNCSRFTAVEVERKNRFLVLIMAFSSTLADILSM